MLKYNIKNYWQFTKTLTMCFQWTTTNKALVMYNYFWLGTVECMCQIWNSFKWIYLFYCRKCVKYLKSFKIQGNGCYDKNVSFISSPKDDLLKFVKFEFRNVSSFCWIWTKTWYSPRQKYRDVLTWFCSYGQFVCFSLHVTITTIVYKNYSKFCTRKCKKLRVHCDSNDISMICINPNMALLRVKND